jgi:hypothetical protein
MTDVSFGLWVPFFFRKEEEKERNVERLRRVLQRRGTKTATNGAVYESLLKRKVLWRNFCPETTVPQTGKSWKEGLYFWSPGKSRNEGQKAKGASNNKLLSKARK